MFVCFETQSLVEQDDLNLLCSKNCPWADPLTLGLQVCVPPRHTQLVPFGDESFRLFLY